MEGSLEDGLLTLDEENALQRYLDHFNIAGKVDDNGVLTSMIHAAVIRGTDYGIVPKS